MMILIFVVQKTILINKKGFVILVCTFRILLTCNNVSMYWNQISRVYICFSRLIFVVFIIFLIVMVVLF